MLGKTAGGLFWMSRYLERSKNIARLVDAGFRIALTQSDSAHSEWASIVATTGAMGTYQSVNSDFDGMKVINFLLRDQNNPSSVISVMKNARNNARLSRTALTRDVWEAVNESWMMISRRLKDPIEYKNLPEVLGLFGDKARKCRVHCTEQCSATIFTTLPVWVHLSNVPIILRGFWM